MADVHTKEQRSYNMRRIRSTNTKPAALSSLRSQQLDMCRGLAVAISYFCNMADVHTKEQRSYNNLPRKVFKQALCIT